MPHSDSARSAVSTLTDSPAREASGPARAPHAFTEFDGVVHERHRMMHISLIPLIWLDD